MKKDFKNNALAKETSEFKKFIMRGNILDMAVGVIIGGAFGKIVTSLVNDILMPLIGILIGGLDFTSLTINIKDATISYGTFIQNIVDFLIIAISIFAFIRLVQKLTHKEKQEEVKTEPKKEDTVILLEEIRDLLKDNKEPKTKKKTTKKA